MGILGERSIYSLHLARAQVLLRIEAPAAGEQALAAQHFVDAGDAAGEAVRGIEEGGVQVRELGTEREQAQCFGPLVMRIELATDHGVAAMQEADGAAG